ISSGSSLNRSWMTSSAPYRIPSAVAFFPPYMRVFVNLVTSLSLNLGSGMIRRFGTSRRRGMVGLAGSSLGVDENFEDPAGCRAGDYFFGRLTPYFERLRLRLT